MSTRLCVIALLLLPVSFSEAAQDNNVEWNGLSHVAWLDRSPRCPIDGESFEIYFRSWHLDLTSARVYVDDGVGTWVDASFVRQEGPYDVWVATIPATAAIDLTYYIEVTDGTDSDYIGPDGPSDGAPASSWWIDHVNAYHAPAGATLTTDGGAVFKVWAPAPSWFPQGDWVAVRGDFNGWGCDALDNIGGGWYCGRVSGVLDGDEYKYYFWDESCGSNSWDWHEDARYRYVNRYDSSNSVVVDPDAYVWHNTDLVPVPHEEMIVYELHVGTFSGYNDGLGRMGRFRDIVDTHLDHLLYLGVNVVELMPVNEFDGYESWGYNPVNQFAPEEAYGNPEDLKYTIDRLHQAGIAVVTDIVFNHFSAGGNYIWDYGDNTYFDRSGGMPGCDTPWGAQAALWNADVRNYFLEAVQLWLEEYQVDGFRMDATRYMRAGDGNQGCYPEGADLMQTINDYIDRRHIDAISIAEELPNSAWATDDTPFGGGFDAQWHDQWNDDIRAEIFAAGFGDPDMGKVANAINGWGYDRAELVRYVESHDEAGGDGNGIDDERLARSIDSGDPYSIWAKGRSKLAQGLTILVPGIPMFLQGGEWLEDRKFDAGAGNRIDWSKAVTRPEMTLFFRDVISVRKSNCGMRADAPLNVYHVNESGNVVVFSRGAGQELVVIANFSNSDYYDYGLPFPMDGTWYEILNSQAAAYAGNNVGNGGSIVASGGGASITIPQMGLLVFRHEDAAGRGTDIDLDGDRDLFDVAWLQQDAGAQGCGMSKDIRENGRVDSVDLEQLAWEMSGPN